MHVFRLWLSFISVQKEPPRFVFLKTHMEKILRSGLQIQLKLSVRSKLLVLLVFPSLGLSFDQGLTPTYHIFKTFSN